MVLNTLTVSASVTPVVIKTYATHVRGPICRKGIRELRYSSISIASLGAKSPPPTFLMMKGLT